MMIIIDNPMNSDLIEPLLQFRKSQSVIATSAHDGPRRRGGTMYAQSQMQDQNKLLIAQSDLLDWEISDQGGVTREPESHIMMDQPRRNDIRRSGRRESEWYRRESLILDAQPLNSGDHRSGIRNYHQNQIKSAIDTTKSGVGVSRALLPALSRLSLHRSHKEQSSRVLKLKQFAQQKPRERKQLNAMLLNLSETIKRRLYLFNLWCNIAYRSMVLAILLLLIAAKSLKLAEALLGFWILSLVIYSLAIGKMIYTRSDTQSVDFQKIFYEKDYADIESDRVWRKHFTLERILSSVCQLFNPCSKFNSNISTSLLRQEIFKRVETVLLTVPFILLFVLNGRTYSLGYPNQDIIVTGLICFEILRITVHYLVVYVCN